MTAQSRRRCISADAAPAPPATIVIFGASGDLAKRLLVPALYNLACDKVLDPGFAVIGIDHAERDDEGFRAHLSDSIQALAADPSSEFGAAAIDRAAWDWLAARLSYVTADFENPDTYRSLAERLPGETNLIFYLATAPRFFGPIVERLSEAGLLQQPQEVFRRVIIEKPFGTDLASAEALNARILKLIDENQIYRIDHFLGKETVQNIMVLRFINGLFEPVWNREHIDHVQITASETIGVEQRGRFYDATGALRDMVPNHMFQLLAMMAMEAPNSFDADAVRSEKAKLVEAVRHWSPEEAMANGVRGQYGAGGVAKRAIAPVLSD